MTERKADAGSAAAIAARLARLPADQRASLATRLRARTAASTGPSIPRAEPLRRESVTLADGSQGTARVFPASHGQRRMWFLHQFAPESPAYTTATAFHIEGPLLIAGLERAINRLIERHAVLRTTFVMENGEVLQRVHDRIPLRLPVIDLSDVPAAEREAAARAHVDSAAARVFDLAAEPPIHAVLVRLGPESHVLLVLVRHIVFDGWSRSIVWRDLSALYAADAGGDSEALPELRIEFADFAAWQCDWLAAGALDSQREHWQRVLASVPPPLDFPSDRARPVTESFRGHRRDRPLDSALFQRLADVARHHDATPFMVLLAAYATLLHRHTGQERIAIGAPIANRRNVEVEHLAGYFANTVVMSIDLAGNPPFSTLLQRVRSAALDAFAHQDMPFEVLVEHLDVQRDAGRTPVFQTTFAIQNYPDRTLHIPGARVTPWPVHTGCSKFDFNTTVERRPEGWATAIEYSTDLFDDDRMERVLEHWSTLLEGITRDPDIAIGDLPLLSDAESRRVRVDWNDTTRPYPRDARIHELFEEQAVRWPDRPAVKCAGQTLSYAELDSAARSVAVRLRAAGLGPGDLAGIVIDRSVARITALLAVLKCGASYWGIEDSLPAPRLAAMLADARPRLVIGSGPPPNLLQTALAEVVNAPAWLDLAENAASWNDPVVFAPVAGQSTDPAYVSYTSGSTGIPKGVVVAHRGVVRLVRGAEYATVGPEETLLHHSPLSFDASTFEIWGALLNGACLSVADPATSSPADYAAAIRNLGVTTAWFTAPLFHVLVDEHLEALTPLRQLLTGGDVVSPAHARRALRALPSCRILNGYGPTENTTFTTTHPITEPDTLAASLPIGRPVSNTRVYVLDPRGQPVPIGVPGDLHAAGDGVALGYLNDPELTAARFPPDPFSADPGARMYRTGDRVRWRADGTLEFLGRLDAQLKIRGFRVEPSEIERALRTVPGVRDAVVTAQRDPHGERFLVAHALPSVPEPPDARTVLDTLRHVLPAYLVPASLIWLTEFPLTPNGKVNRAALECAAPPSASTGSSAKPPRDTLEEAIARAWDTVFPSGGFGRDTNFFEIGGHSLLAARLAAALERNTAHHIPIAALFEAPTIAALAAWIRRDDAARSDRYIVPLQSGGSRPPLFCVHGVGGDVYAFLHLARRLAPDQPVLGIQAAGVASGGRRHGDVREMAAHYAREVLAACPEGPIQLLGYSLGGWIAHAVACELQSATGRVTFLGVLDTRATCQLPWLEHASVQVPWLITRFPHHLRRALRAPAAERTDYARGRLQALLAHLTRLLGPRAKRNAAPTGPRAPGTSPVTDYFQELAARHRPGRFAGDIHVFAAPDAAAFPHARLWRHHVTGHVHRHTVAGTHTTLIQEEHLDVFTSRLQAALAMDRATTR